MYVIFACMCMCHMCMQCPQRPVEGIKFPGIGQMVMCCQVVAGNRIQIPARAAII